jgi:hypothetical protein
MIVFFSNGLMAQRSLTIKGGLNYNMLPLVFKDVNNKVSPLSYELAPNGGGHVGLFANIPFSSRFSFSPGVNLIGRGGGQGERQRVSIYYADLPLNITYHLSNKISFEVGPVVSYRLLATAYSYRDQKRISYTKSIEPVSFGTIGGISFLLKENLSIHLSYYRSFVMAWDTSFQSATGPNYGTVKYFPSDVSLSFGWRLKG